MMMQDNLPPLLDETKPLAWQPSFRAFVRYGRDFGEHGGARNQKGQRNHKGTLHLGAEKGTLIELRVVDARFFSEQSFTVYIERHGERVEAGKAPPHEDGKGYRWTLTETANDGDVFELQSDGPLNVGAARKPARRRSPKAQHKP